jgi:hypothetical protein
VESAGEAPELHATRRIESAESNVPMATAASMTGQPAQEITAQDAANENATRALSNVSVASEAEAGAADERSKRLPPRMAAARLSGEGKIGPRVEKLRQASNVMLEEASSDPGLRFVLVALALFLLSMLFLLLNHLLG